MKSKQMLTGVILGTLLLGLFLASPVQIQAADGSAGSMEIGATSAFDGAIVAVRCYGLTVSADFVVNHTSDLTGFSFTTGASQTEFTVYLTIDKPADSETVYVWLYGDALLDTQTLQVKDDSMIPDEFLISLGITLLVLFIIVGIVKRMRK